MSQSVDVEFSKRAVALRILSVAVLYAVVRLKGIVTLPLFTRLLGPGEFGRFALISVTVNLLWPLVALNLHSGCGLYLVHLRQPAEIARSYFSTLHVMLLAGLAGTALAALTAPWTGLQGAVGGHVLLTAALILAALLSQAVQVPLTSFQRTRQLFIYTAATEYGAAALGILLLLAGAGLTGLLGAMAVVPLAGSLIVVGGYLREFGYFPRIDWPLVRRYLRAALPYLPVSFSLWGLQSLDSYFILFYLGAGAVGINSVAYSLAGLLMGVLTLLNYVYYPTLVAIWDQARDQFYAAVVQSIRYAALLCGWIIVLFAAASPLLVRLLAAPGFAAAAGLVPLIAAAFTLHVLTQMFQAATLTVDKNTLPLALSYLTGLAVNAALNPLTIPRFGLPGAAWNTAAAYAVTHALVMLLAIRKAQHQLNWRIQLAGLPAVALGWAAAAWLATPGWLAALWAILAGTAVYGAVAALTGLLQAGDLARARSLLREVLHG